MVSLTLRITIFPCLFMVFCAERVAQPSGGQVFQLGKIQIQFLHAAKRLGEFRLQLRRGGGVQAAFQRDVQRSAHEIFLYSGTYRPGFHLRPEHIDEFACT